MRNETKKKAVLPKEIQRHWFAADVGREFEGMNLVVEDFFLQRHDRGDGIFSSAIIF